jgi:protein-tyrosine phosphatase/arsenate reductase
MNQKIQTTCNQLVNEFDQISASRKEILEKIAVYIQNKINDSQPIRLVYVCTHNSRRSHFGQIWGKVAASYFGITSVQTFSAGTESTAMHPNTVNALKTIGFHILSDLNGDNPHYSISFSEDEETLVGFSKTLDDVSLPKTHFAAIMTCSEAEENCPFVPGAELRISTTYDDPKVFDGTMEQDEKYIERSLQIARDNLYVFSLVK